MRDPDCPCTRMVFRSGKWRCVRCEVPRSRDAERVDDLRRVMEADPGVRRQAELARRQSLFPGNPVWAALEAIAAAANAEREEAEAEERGYEPLD